MKRPNKISHLYLDKKVCKKVYFGTKKDADAYVSKLAKESTRDKVPVRSYLCPHCNCWHLTSWAEIDMNKLIDEFNRQVDKINREAQEWYDEHEEFVIQLSNTIVELKQANKKLQQQINYNNNL